MTQYFDGITIGLLGFCLGQNVNTIILKSKQARKIFSNQPRVNLSNTNNPLYHLCVNFGMLRTTFMIKQPKILWYKTWKTASHMLLAVKKEFNSIAMWCHFYKALNFLRNVCYCGYDRVFYTYIESFELIVCNLTHRWT